MAGFFEAVNPTEQLLNPNALDRRRKMAEALAKDSTSTAPVQHWTQALARVLQGAGAGFENARLDKSEKANQAESNRLLMGAYDAISGGGGQQQRLVAALTPDPNAPGAESAGVPAPAGDPTGGAKAQALPMMAQTAQPGSTAFAPPGSGTAPVERLAALSGRSLADSAGMIQDYLKTGGQNLNPQEKAWCATTINSSLAQSGLPTTGSNMARSFLNYGETTPTPQRGDIAVFSRGNPNGPYGHVGFYVGDAPNGGVRVLGGNQGGGINEKVFPASQLLDIRRIPGQQQQLPVSAYAPTQDGAAPALQAIQNSASPPVPMPPPRPPELGGSAGLPQQLPGAAAPTPTGQPTSPVQPQQAQPAPSGAGNQRAALVALLTNPYASPEAKQIGAMLMKDQLGRQVTTVDMGNAIGVMDHTGNIVRTIPKSRDATDEAMKQEALRKAQRENSTPRTVEITNSNGEKVTAIYDEKTGGFKLPSVAGQQTDNTVTLATGERVPVPAGVDPKEFRKKLADDAAGNITKAPQAIAQAQDALTLIESIKNHPGKQYGTGVLGVLPGIPGTPQRDFVNRVDQLKGKNFLEAYNTLRGGGAITETEGKKATEAIARLDRAQSPKDFDAALDELSGIIKRGVERAQKTLGQTPQAAPAAPAPAVNLKQKYGLE